MNVFSRDYVFQTILVKIKCLFSPRYSGKVNAPLITSFERRCIPYTDNINLDNLFYSKNQWKWSFSGKLLQDISLHSDKYEQFTVSVACLETTWKETIIFNVSDSLFSKKCMKINERISLISPLKQWNIISFLIFIVQFLLFGRNINCCTFLLCKR